MYMPLNERIGGEFMSRSSISTGHICVDDMSAGKIKRDILPDNSKRYKNYHEQKKAESIIEQRNTARFIAFIKSKAASLLHDCFDECV